MQSVFATVGTVYFLLVANFYYQSNGFNDHYTYHYSFWKVTPIAFLSAFAYFHGGNLGEAEKKTAALGLIFGGIGDWIIGIARDGIILGAVAFGIGHLLYLSLFLQHYTKIHNRSLLLMLAWGAVVGQVCLIPLLPEHIIPVSVFTLYSLLLSSVTIIAISQYLNGSKTQSEEGLFLRAIGFFLFYCSDSVLIMCHTGIWKLYANLVVLGTYYAAQYFILYGNCVARVPIVQKLK